MAEVIDYNGGHLACYYTNGIFVKDGKIVSLVIFPEIFNKQYAEDFVGEKQKYSADRVERSSNLKTPLSLQDFISFVSESISEFGIEDEEVDIKIVDKISKKYGFRVSEVFNGLKDCPWTFQDGSHFTLLDKKELHQLIRIAQLQGVELPIKDMASLPPEELDRIRRANEGNDGDDDLPGGFPPRGGGDKPRGAVVNSFCVMREQNVRASHQHAKHYSIAKLGNFAGNI